jgi:putative lipoprotein
MIQTARLTALSALLLCLAACNSPESDPETAQVQDEAIIVTEDITAPATGKALPGTAWWVEDILSAGVIDRARTTIAFNEDGRAAGNGGCNRFTGSYTLDGAGISFGPMAGTMMACPDALMNQDRRFHEALGQVTRWRIDAQTGLLHLENQDGETLIRASALPEGEEA